MEKKQNGVQPIFQWLAKFGVNPFILGNKQTREYRESDVKSGPRRLGREEQRNSQTEKHGKRIERVSQSFPKWQAPFAMEDEFIDPQRKPLGREDENCKDWNHILRINEP